VTSEEHGLTQPSATGAVDVAADPAVVYGLLVALASLVDIAEETAALTWVKGTAAVPGAKFRGRNRIGLRRWSTTCTVTDADPDTRFAFEVRYPPGILVARWQYDIAPTDGASGCRVTESTWDRRPVWFKGPSVIVTGVRDRRAVNTVNIERTLQRLKQRAEAAS
jgi:hypothetical protein